MKKVFFDTNFLMRFYLDDIPDQASKAKEMIQAAKKGALLLVTDLIVICEMVWVMDSFYGLDKEEISEKMTNLYRTPGISIINGELLPDVLAVYVDKNIDFTDAVIGVSATKNHIEYLASFDKKHMGRMADLGLKRIESLEEVL
ncbi:MAG: PIN domain-containing protein [Deltaproteobacteria bacterium]|jgi:predicted nucleic-acid-binding protein|nr:PIN domain-containing protein [Deltaproteobacteria bacterium]